MITAEDLTKTYGAKTAVDGSRFTVRLGQVTGFLDPNGAGRSTAMGMIVGLDRPTSVTVNGRPNAEHRSPLTEVGALLEAKAVHIGRSAVAQLRAVAATHGFGRKQVAEVIEMTGLQSVSGKRVGGSGRRMRAAVYHRFGGPDVVRVEEVPRPTVGRSDVLIRVRATTVSAADHRARSRDIPPGLWLLAAFGIGILRPKRPVLGMDAAGVVEAVGADINKYQPGDEVIAMLGARFGGHAEYAVVRQDDPIALKPPNMTFEDAVTLVFGGLTARGFLKQADVAPGATVLVNGAAGAVGTAAVQLAKHAAARVTGVCS